MLTAEERAYYHHRATVVDDGRAPTGNPSWEG